MAMDGGSWLHRYLREKNTFLEPKEAEGETQEGGGEMRRHNSEPSLSSQCSSSEDKSSFLTDQKGELRGTKDGWLEDRLKHASAGGATSSGRAAHAPLQMEANPSNSNPKWQHIVYDTSSDSFSEHAPSSYEGASSNKVEHTNTDFMHWDQALDSAPSSQQASPNPLDSGNTTDTGCVAHHMFASMTNAELEELKGRIPLNESRHLTSIGSIGHAIGDCIPCENMAENKGCPNGLLCTSCHFAHLKPGGKQCKPGKTQRDRYRKFVSEVMLQIEQDPDGFDVNLVNIPASLTPTEMLKKKFVVRITNHLLMVKATRKNEEGTSGSGSTPAPPYPVKMKMSL